MPKYVKILRHSFFPSAEYQLKNNTLSTNYRVVAITYSVYGRRELKEEEKEKRKETIKKGPEKGSENQKIKKK